MVEKKFEEKIEVSYGQYLREVLNSQVVVIREFQRVLGNERAKDIIVEWSTRQTIDGISKMLENEEIKIESFSDFREYERKMWASPRVLKTHSHEIVEDNPEKLACNVTECVWAKTMIELNAADLGKILFCDNDFIGAKAYHQNVVLTRKKTLMEGHNCCDFVYTWDAR